MIPLSVPASNRKSWQQQLVEGFHHVQELLDYLELGEWRDPLAEAAAGDFPLRVTRYYAGLMEKGNPHDPLLLQVLPSGRELEAAPGFSRDPTGDLPARAGHGLLRKYAGRALVITTGHCAIHCRYCFRRHYPYRQDRATPGAWDSTLQELAQDPSISEVILSGGDPLTLSNRRLETLLRQLDGLPHVRRLRLHSRLPVVLPERVDPGLVQLLSASRLGCTLVLHVNHPRELTPRLAGQLAPLAAKGIILLNQSVLLHGINDTLDTQVDLCESLFDFRILPYYLHQLDKVEGAARFLVPEQQARALHRAMRERLPGYLLPRLVQEKPGAGAKLPL